VLLEFVSANPTGPLHVGHGRHAAFGASLGNLLEAVGFAVKREYYVNDAGRQMDILAASTWLRYLERCGEKFSFPANGYRGEYIAAIADKLFAARGAALRRSAAEVFEDLPPDEPQGGDKDLYIDAVIARARSLIGEAEFRAVLTLSLEDILADIRDDLREFGVNFDRWFSERSLSEDGSVDRAIERAQEGRSRLSQGRRAVVQEHRLRRRERPRHGARQRRQDLFRVGHRLHIQQARARLSSIFSTSGAPIITATSCGCARASSRSAGRRNASRSGWCSSFRCFAAARKRRCRRARASS
jgi:arginyl-tRNA synthetase